MPQPPSTGIKHIFLGKLSLLAATLQILECLGLQDSSHGKFHHPLYVVIQSQLAGLAQRENTT